VVDSFAGKGVILFKRAILTNIVFQDTKNVGKVIQDSTLSKGETGLFGGVHDVRKLAKGHPSDGGVNETKGELHKKRRPGNHRRATLHIF